MWSRLYTSFVLEMPCYVCCLFMFLFGFVNSIKIEKCISLKRTRNKNVYATNECTCTAKYSIMVKNSQWQNCSIHCKSCPLQQMHVTTDQGGQEHSVCAHKRKGCSWVSQPPPVLQNQSQRRGWWNRDRLLANSRQACCPPTDPLSSIRQAPLTLGFCDAVGWNLQFTVHSPVTFYTSLVTELLFFLGCLDDLTKGLCECAAFTHLLVCRWTSTDWSFVSRLDPSKTYFQWKRRWKILGLAFLQGRCSEGDSMLICWDKSTGPSWALMNSSEQDYRTPGAGFARIPAMRESFIGCISRQRKQIFNAGCCPLKQSRVSLLGRSGACVFKPHKSSAVQWICPGKPHGELRRKRRITFQLSHVWSSNKRGCREWRDEHTMQRRRIAPFPAHCPYQLVD